jgi:XTP/dITP diphosphohydrolase
MEKLLIATGNQGKILEFKEIFKELSLAIKLVSLEDLEIKEKLKETGRSFKENAVQKAEFYYNLSKIPTLSDDAGMEIDYLKGEPGVYSRRWPGYEASDEKIIQMTLKKLKGVPEEKRGAQLRAVIGLIFPEDEKVYTFEGVLRGRIAETSAVKKVPGYPFRSVFIPEKQEKYLGELHIVAHRKQAVEKALPMIKKYLCSI